MSSDDAYGEDYSGSTSSEDGPDMWNSKPVEEVAEEVDESDEESALGPDNDGEEQAAEDFMK